MRLGPNLYYTFGKGQLHGPQVSTLFHHQCFWASFVAHFSHSWVGQNLLDESKSDRAGPCRPLHVVTLCPFACDCKYFYLEVTRICVYQSCKLVSF